MNCNKCGGKGYLESMCLVSNRVGSTIAQCCDITKYSIEVQRRLNSCARDTESDERKAARELGHGNGIVINMGEFRR